MITQTREEIFQLAIRRILEESKDAMQTRYSRDAIQEFIDYEFTSKGLTENQLRAEVDGHYSGLRWYDKIALKFRVKKASPRIRAFEKRLSEIMD